MFDMIPDDIDKMVNTVFISCRKEAQSIIVKLRTQDFEENCYEILAIKHKSIIKLFNAK
jgi:hypothetical protein